MNNLFQELTMNSWKRECDLDERESKVFYQTMFTVFKFTFIMLLVYPKLSDNIGIPSDSLIMYGVIGICLYIVAIILLRKRISPSSTSFVYYLSILYIALGASDVIHLFSEDCSTLVHLGIFIVTVVISYTVLNIIYKQCFLE